MDEGGEAFLHEELLSLLDAGLCSDGLSGAAIIDHDNLYTLRDRGRESFFYYSKKNLF